MVGFLAVLSENIFSCFWNDKHSLQMKFQYKTMLLDIQQLYSLQLGHPADFFSRPELIFQAAIRSHKTAEIKM